MIDRLKFKNWDCRINYSKYPNGKCSLMLTDYDTGEPIAHCTINDDAIHKKIDDTMNGQAAMWDEVKDAIVIIKDYSENEGMYDALEAAGMFYAKWADVDIGYVSVPLVQLSPMAMEGWK